jgi:hypothetical protein
MSNVMPLSKAKAIQVVVCHQNLQELVFQHTVCYHVGP